MTTLAQDIQALLATLGAAGGVHQRVNEQQPVTCPYLVWSRLPTVPNVSLKGPSNLQQTHLQVDVFHTDPLSAEALANSVSAMFAAWSVPNIPQLELDMFELDTRLFRFTREFSIWATN